MNLRAALRLVFLQIFDNFCNQTTQIHFFAAEFGIPVTQVTNYLAFARRELRRLVLERLQTLCATDEEFRLEARDFLGVDPA